HSLPPPATSDLANLVPALAPPRGRGPDDREAHNLLHRRETAVRRADPRPDPGGKRRARRMHSCLNESRHLERRLHMTTDVTLSEYEEGSTYLGAISDQLVTESTDGKPQVILTVTPRGRLCNERNVAAGIDPCPHTDVEVRITLDLDDPERLGWAVRDLESAGFVQDDVSLLHPDHPQHVSLLGQEVCIRPKLVGGRLYWNLVRLRKSVALDSLTQCAQELTAKIAAAKQRARKGIGDKKAKQTQPPAPVAEPHPGGEAT